jgi:PAS domain S-box-containing protein
MAAGTGLQFAELIHPDDRPRMWSAAGRCITHGEPFEVEYRIETKGGQEIWLWEHAQGVFDGSGKLTSIEGFVTNVTARRQAQQALTDSEARYRDLFENANDLVQSVDAEGRILYVNRAWRETLGYEAEDLPRLRLFDIIDPESRAHCAETFQRVLRGEKMGRIDAVFRTRDGRRIVVEGTVNVRLEAGRAVSTRAIFRDVTESREGEAALRASQQAAADARRGLQAVLDAATQVSIIATDPQGLITVFNAGAERMLGYRAEEMVGRETPARIHLAAEVEARGAELSEALGRPVRGFDVFVERARQEGHEEREWTYRTGARRSG